MSVVVLISQLQSVIIARPVSTAIRRRVSVGVARRSNWGLKLGFTVSLGQWRNYKFCSAWSRRFTSPTQLPGLTCLDLGLPRLQVSRCLQPVDTAHRNNLNRFKVFLENREEKREIEPYSKAPGPGYAHMRINADAILPADSYRLMILDNEATNTVNTLATAHTHDFGQLPASYS